MYHCETYISIFVVVCFQKSEICYFEKFAIEIDVFSVKQASEKENVGSKLRNSNYRK